MLIRNACANHILWLFTRQNVSAAVNPATRTLVNLVPAKAGNGFYARRLTPAAICRFWNIIDTEGFAPGLAALRVRLRSSLERDPGNRRVLREASKLLARWYSLNYRFDKTNSYTIKNLIRGILEDYSGLSPRQPGAPSQQNNDFDKTNRFAIKNLIRGILEDYSGLSPRQPAPPPQQNNDFDKTNRAYFNHLFLAGVAFLRTKKAVFNEEKMCVLQNESSAVQLPAGNSGDQFAS